MFSQKESYRACNYCGVRTEAYAVKSWNKDETRYYCIKHYHDAAQREIEERDRFIEYYSEESRRKWLPPSSLKLWEELKRKQNI